MATIVVVLPGYLSIIGRITVLWCIADAISLPCGMDAVSGVASCVIAAWQQRNK